jgi:ABC-type transporter Mla subunit MlaD
MGAAIPEPGGGMSSRTHHFRIGLFVLIGACLFIGALFAMGLKSYFGQRDVFETSVPGRVENLSLGALVKLRGVTIGKVTGVDFVGTEYPEYKEQAVVIHFEVPKHTVWSAETDNVQQALDAEVAKGLRARVQGQGFLGASIVSLEYVDPTLYPVEPIPWTPKHYYIPSAPSQFNRVFTSLEKSLRHAEDLDLADLLDRAQGLIANANRLAGNLNEVDFKQLGTNADSLVLDLRETNYRLQGAIKDVDLPRISRDTAALEARLSGAAIELRRVLGSVDTGELNGSLANIRNATDELIVLLHTLEQRPSSVLFSKSPEPVSELDKPPKK